MPRAKKHSKRDRFDHATKTIEDSIAELEELKEEYDTWRDGLSGTNLEYTMLAESLDTVIDVLGIGIDELQAGLETAQTATLPKAFGS